MTGSGAPADRVEKIMSIRRDEFEVGLERLSGAPPVATAANGAVVYLLRDAARGDADKSPPLVRCTFEPLPDTVLGGLLRLPRARVELDLTDMPGPERSGFIDRFDLIFQRGGG